MAAYDVVSFNGTALGSGTNYDAWLDARDEYVMTSSIDTFTRRSASPLVTGTSEEGRTITLHVANAAGSSLTAAQFRDAVKELFDPRLNGSGERLLVIEGDDGTTDVQIGVYVAQIAYLSEGIDRYVVTLWARQNYWQATSVTTSAANPATVTNAGNTIAYPTIELTTTSTVTRRACTVTAASASQPLIGYPVVFALNSANATNTNVFVFIEGVSVPCYVDNSGAATSRVWALVDAVSSRATNVDILYAAGFANPLCQTLLPGGSDWADDTNCTNAIWEWNDWSVVTTNEPRPGVWLPDVMGNHSEASGATYAITTENATTLTISLGAAGTYDNSADCVRMRVEGSRAGTTNALADLSRATANLDGTNARAFVRYRVANSTTWVDAWTTVGNASTSTAIDLDNAVEIIAGIENHGATADPATLTLSTAVFTPKLTLTGTPTVVVGAATTYDRYDGTYTIGDRSITFANYMVPDGTLTIDCEARTITSSVAGPVYWVDDGDDANQPIAFSHPDQWLVLSPGSNTVTDGLTSTTDVVKHRDSYV